MMKRVTLPERPRPQSRPSQIPPPHVERWVPGRKANVAGAVIGGVLSAEDACRRYGLANEELQTWIASFQQHGTVGLRVTQLSNRQSSIPHDRYDIAKDGPGWMVLDTEEKRPAIAEDLALNGLLLRDAQALTEALNALHRKIWRTCRHRSTHGYARESAGQPRQINGRASSRSE